LPENPKVNNVGHPYNTKKLLTYTHKNTQKKQKNTHTHTQVCTNSHYTNNKVQKVHNESTQWKMKCLECAKNS